MKRLLTPLNESELACVIGGEFAIILPPVLTSGSIITNPVLTSGSIITNPAVLVGLNPQPEPPRILTRVVR